MSNMFDVTFIEITNRKQDKFVFVIDNIDFDTVWGDYRWSVDLSNNTVYAKAHKGRCTLRMHALIAGTPKGRQTDHLNGMGTDNRRSNLRICSIAENQHNRRINRPRAKKGPRPSVYKGVCWHTRRQQWEVLLRKRDKALGAYKDGTTKLRYLVYGSFKCEHDAARFYNEQALKHFGAEHANLNIIQDPNLQSYIEMPLSPESSIRLKDGLESAKNHPPVQLGDYTQYANEDDDEAAG